jgi:hypothetical protein
VGALERAALRSGGRMHARNLLSFFSSAALTLESEIQLNDLWEKKFAQEGANNSQLIIFAGSRQCLLLSF